MLGQVSLGEEGQSHDSAAVASGASSSYYPPHPTHQETHVERLSLRELHRGAHRAPSPQARTPARSIMAGSIATRVEHQRDGDATPRCRRRHLLHHGRGSTGLHRDAKPTGGGGAVELERDRQIDGATIARWDVRVLSGRHGDGTLVEGAVVQQGVLRQRRGHQLLRDAVPVQLTPDLWARSL